MSTSDGNSRAHENLSVAKPDATAITTGSVLMMSVGTVRPRVELRRKA